MTHFSISANPASAKFIFPMGCQRVVNPSTMLATKPCDCGASLCDIKPGLPAPTTGRVLLCIPIFCMTIIIYLSANCQPRWLALLLPYLLPTIDVIPTTGYGGRHHVSRQCLCQRVENESNWLLDDTNDDDDDCCRNLDWWSKQSSV